ncbi:MAG TPA: hypothetical protein DDW81_03090 [Cryomorphaceae bacterium]|nr:hypothetical protein [Owenweeksia sp.]HBF19054.1 hypothetical protein [Cryomorphaceae bacterium]|tara:strand:+ start:5416 stop:6813 length:1398 start_codon:yes stop_codon:yes gene_type:complete
METETLSILTLKDWSHVAKPMEDGSDTALLLKAARHTRLKVAPHKQADEPGYLNDKVALRHRDWDDDFLSSFEHAPFDHPMLKEAERLLQSWPEMYAQCGVIVHEFNPVFIKGIEGRRDHPGSNSHQPADTLGSMWATVHNPVLLAQAIVHETAHNKLFSLGQHFETPGPLFTNQPDQLYDSPVRLDIPRPMPAVFHGVYAFTHVLALDRRMLSQVKMEYRDFVHGLLYQNAMRIKKGLQWVERCAKLTPEGQAFMSTFLPWAHEEVKQGLAEWKATGSQQKEGPIALIGLTPESRKKVINQLIKETRRKVVRLDEIKWQVWAQSAVVQQKQLAKYGSVELVKAFNDSGKFHPEQYLRNWLKEGVFNLAEYEFLKLQLANYAVKQYPKAILDFGHDNALLEQPEFLARLQQLFRETNARVIYARPLASVEETLHTLKDHSTDVQHIRKALEAPAYRTLGMEVAPF